MKILVIIPNELDEPSTRFRIVQYQQLLEPMGFEFEYLSRKSIAPNLPQHIRESDVIFNNRCLFRTGLARKILAGEKRTIFDFDDAVYTRPGRKHSFITNLRVKTRFHIWLKNASVVSTSNRFLAQYASKHRDAVDVLTMALDLDFWKPAKNKNFRNDTVTLGWIGSPVNVPLIESLDDVLCELMQKNESIRLAILSGKKPNLTCPFEYFSFSSKDEYNFVNQLDIGLLPLVHGEYMSGKSPIKAVQYLACGVPVVGNVFGGTAEILSERNSVNVSTDKEWINALDSLANNVEKRKTFAKNGREFVLKHHNIKSNVAQLRKLLVGNRKRK